MYNVLLNDTTGNFIKSKTSSTDSEELITIRVSNLPEDTHYHYYLQPSLSGFVIPPIFLGEIGWLKILHIHVVIDKIGSVLILV